MKIKHQETNSAKKEKNNLLAKWEHTERKTNMKNKKDNYYLASA